MANPCEDGSPPLSEAASSRAELSRLSVALGEDIGRAYTERAEGFWAIHENDLQTAVSHFEVCVGLWKKLGWHYDLARARVALAAVYRESGRPASASPLLELATEYFAKIGAKTDPEQAIALEELVSGPIRAARVGDAPRVA